MESPWVSAVPTSALRARRRTRSSSAASVLFRTVMSRKTSTAPAILPSASRMGAALSSMGRSVPSLPIRTVWFASPTTMPSLKARKAGFSTALRVSSLTIRNTLSRSWPWAPASLHPISVWATGLRKFTLPPVSVAITASPMLASVVRNHSRCS